MRKIMKLKPRNGGPEEIIEIGGIKSEQAQGYWIVGIDGNDLGYFGADRYENMEFSIEFVNPPKPEAPARLNQQNLRTVPKL
jgi:hypothetical protein